MTQDKMPTYLFYPISIIIFFWFPLKCDLQPLMPMLLTWTNYVGDQRGCTVSDTQNITPPEFTYHRGAPTLLRCQCLGEAPSPCYWTSKLSHFFSLMFIYSYGWIVWFPIIPSFFCKHTLRTRKFEKSENGQPWNWENNYRMGCQRSFRHLVSLHLQS